MEPSTSSIHRLRPLAPAPADVARPPVAEVVGMPLALTDYERTMDWMDAAIARRERAIVTAAAVHLVMVAAEDPETRAALARDEVLAVPDGQPLHWALKALGHRDASRVYGPDLMAKYCERSARTGTRMYLYGGRNQGALVQLTLSLRKLYPGLRIVGGYSPPFRPLTAEEESWVVADINRSRADVVWVGTGQPKQEKWMAAMRDRLEAPILAGKEVRVTRIGPRLMTERRDTVVRAFGRQLVRERAPGRGAAGARTPGAGDPRTRSGTRT